MTKQDDIASVKRQLRDLKPRTPNRLIISIPYVLIILVLIGFDIALWIADWPYGFVGLMVFSLMGVMWIFVWDEYPIGTKAEDYELKRQLKVALRDVRKEKS